MDGDLTALPGLGSDGHLCPDPRGTLEHPNHTEVLVRQQPGDIQLLPGRKAHPIIADLQVDSGWAG